MTADDLSGWLQRHWADWPGDDALPLTRQLRERLAALPAEVSGVLLKSLKNTALPPAKEADPAALAGWLRSQEAPPADEAGATDRLRALVPSDRAGPLLPEEQVPVALAAARVLRGLGDNCRAAQLLAACSRAARRRPEGTFFALWLLEVARAWLDDTAPVPVQSGVLADLGALVALSGDVPAGSALIGSAASRLFEYVAAAPDAEARSAAWQLRYEAARWRLRVRRPEERNEAINDLKGILNPGGVEPGSATWFHVQFELIFAEAGPNTQAADEAAAEQLRRQLDQAPLPPAVKEALTAHAHEALGHTLHFGNNPSLHAQAARAYETAAAAFERAGDWPGLSWVLDALGRARTQLGDHTGADAALERSMALKQHLKDLWGLGASFNARANSLMRRGRPLEAVPLYDANLELLRQTPGVELGLILQNLGQKVTAYLAPYQNPLEADERKPAPADLRRMSGLLQEYGGALSGRPGQSVSRGYHLMHRGALARVRARRAKEAAARLALLARGERLVRKAIATFRAARFRVALPNAEIHLAGLLTDHARLLTESADQAGWLRKARAWLLRAEESVWDSHERAYLELAWAWYYRVKGQAASAERHIAIARHQALSCGNTAIQVHAEAGIAVHLRGPTGQDRADVILPRGSSLDVPVFAVDWRGRPLADYFLRAALVPHPDHEGVRVDLSAAEARTDGLGRASFRVSAAADAPHGRAFLEVRDQNGVRGLRVEVHVQPFAVVLGAGCPHDLRLGADEEVILRHLFGPRVRRVVIQRRFGGLSGARVLLVEPFLAPPPNLGAADAGGATLQGQPCLVKIGDLRRIDREFSCYDEHVKDILAPNAARIMGRVTWGDHVGIRMSLAGDQDWERSKDEIEWLLGASPVEAHHLLVDMFARDLGACWYTNGSVPEETRLYQAYGDELPVLLTVSEPRRAGGLHGDRPPNALTPITEGLRPADDPRRLRKGNRVYLGELEVADWARNHDGDWWVYELVNPSDRLRVAFRTTAAPQHLDPDGAAGRLIGRRFHVTGVVEELALDRLSEALKSCVEAFPRSGAEEVALERGGAGLTIRTGAEALTVPNPLLRLHDLLEGRLQHLRSIIHGDLHTRNVIVTPRGVPYYIDFGETRIGPTLFDFIKHEVYLWLWSLASLPEQAPHPPCTLAEGLELMRALSGPQNRFPAPFALPPSLDRRSWRAKFYHCVSTVRSLARQHSVLREEAPDYFVPLALYAALMLRWCDPRDADGDEARAARARQGVFLTLLSALLLDEGGKKGPAR
jgi:hypothetical protein